MEKKTIFARKFKNQTNMANQKENQLQLDLSPEIARGVYSNFAIISHSHAEFVMDLSATLPGLDKAQVVSRVILAPEHAKRLLLALQDNVMRYEKEYGQISLDNKANTGAPVPPRTANPFGEA
jgi:hypothetical protein